MSSLRVGMPVAGCQVGVARISGQMASPVTDSLYLSVPPRLRFPEARTPLTATAPFKLASAGRLIARLGPAATWGGPSAPPQHAQEGRHREDRDPAVLAQRQDVLAIVAHDEIHLSLQPARQDVVVGGVA